MTDGGAGEANDLFDQDTAARRQVEQVRAAKILGVADVKFGNHIDGLLEPNVALRRDIATVIRKTRSSLVVTHAPERNYGSIRFSHPDHIAVGHATLAAVYPDARNPGPFPELVKQGLTPHVVPEAGYMVTVSPITP